MKVLLAHKYFYVESGNDFFFFEVGRVLEENGHEVAYFSTLDDRNRKSEYTEYFVNAPAYLEGSVVEKARGFPQMIYSREAKRQFARLIRDFKPDIVHVFGIFVQISPSILDACRDAGVPVVLSCNDFKLICTNYKLYHHGRVCEQCKGNRFYRPIVNKCCQDSWVFSIASSIEAYAHHFLKIYRRDNHTFLFECDFMRRKHEEFWGKDSFHWRILKNPFDSASYTPSYEYGDYLLYFGRLIDVKGVDVLVSAMSRLPRHIRLVIVGNGPQEDQLRARTANENIDNVEFVGPKWEDDLEPFLKNARFVVTPSIWQEPFPYVIIQSFASGKAVVGSDRGGIPELVHDGKFGLTYPAENSEALARCIAHLWEKPDEAVKMGKAARAYVEKEFNDERFYGGVIDIYQDVLSNRR